MSKLFDNMLDGAKVGGIIGGALDMLIVGSATAAAGPVGFALSSKLVISKTAAGTLIGSGVGVVKTVSEKKRKGCSK